MDYDEALAWLRGERSMTNSLMNLEFDPNQRQETIVNIQTADAAMTQQAYWIVRAHKEKLLEDKA